MSPTHPAHRQDIVDRPRIPGTPPTVHRAHQLAPRTQQEALMPGTITLTSPFPIRSEPGTGRIICAPGWGLRTDGTAYYDPSGAAIGEAAALVYDPLTNRHLLDNTKIVLFSCERCGVTVSEPGMCRVCADEKNIRAVRALRGIGCTLQEIADELDLPVPVVRHLVRKGSQKAI